MLCSGDGYHHRPANNTDATRFIVEHGHHPPHGPLGRDVPCLCGTLRRLFAVTHNGVCFLLRSNGALSSLWVNHASQTSVFDTYLALDIERPGGKRDPDGVGIA